MKKPKECGHEVLSFGSGAYYIICELCNFTWNGGGEYGAVKEDNGGTHGTYGIRVFAPSNKRQEQIAKYRSLSE